MEIAATTKLEEIAIKIDAHGKAAIENILTVGKLLCEAKKELPHTNDFGDWRSKRLSWMNNKMASRFMNAFKNNGGILTGHNVTSTILYELTAPDVPESAREEALEHNKLTVKQSKEIAQAHKEIEALKAKCVTLEDSPITEVKPDINRLIPGVREVYDRNGIMEARALKISIMPEEGQQQWLSIYSNNLSLENQLNEKTARVAELENIPELKPEIIEKIIEVMPEGVEDKIKDADKKNRQANKIIKSMDALREEKEEIEKQAENLNSERNNLERKIKVLESQNEVKTPSSIDNSRALKLNRLLNELEWIFPEIKEEVRLAGGEMQETKRVITSIIQQWSSILHEIDGQLVIDI